LSPALDYVGHLSGLTAVAWERQLSIHGPATDFGQFHATLRMSSDEL